jgi:hypothetical protein
MVVRENRSSIVETRSFERGSSRRRYSIESTRSQMVPCKRSRSTIEIQFLRISLSKVLQHWIDPEFQSSGQKVDGRSGDTGLVDYCLSGTAVIESTRTSIVACQLDGLGDFEICESWFHNRLESSSLWRPEFPSLQRTDNGAIAGISILNMRVVVSLVVCSLGVMHKYPFPTKARAQLALSITQEPGEYCRQLVSYETAEAATKHSTRPIIPTAPR